MEKAAEQRELYEKATEQALAEAQYRLIFIYEKLYEKAVEQGDLAKAQYNLAWMYLKGEGEGQNIQLAIELYEKAVEQGLAEAQYNLHEEQDDAEAQLIIEKDMIREKEWGKIYS